MRPYELLFLVPRLFDPTHTYQNGGIQISLKTTTTTAQCDKLTIQTRAVSNNFAQLTLARGFAGSSCSKKGGGFNFASGGEDNTVNLVKTCDKYTNSIGGLATNYANLAVKRYAMAGASTATQVGIFGGSDGTPGATLATISLKLESDNLAPTDITPVLATSAMNLDAHSTEPYIFIAMGNTLSTTVINSTDMIFTDIKANSVAYHSGFTNSAAGRAMGGNETRMLVCGGTDNNSHWFSTMEEVAAISKLGARSWGTLGTARADFGMAGSQIIQILTNGRIGAVTSNQAREFINMEIRGVITQFDNSAVAQSGGGVDSGSD